MESSEDSIRIKTTCRFRFDIQVPSLEVNWVVLEGGSLFVAIDDKVASATCSKYDSICASLSIRLCGMNTKLRFGDKTWVVIHICCHVASARNSWELRTCIARCSEENCLCRDIWYRNVEYVWNIRFDVNTRDITNISVQIITFVKNLLLD